MMTGEMSHAATLTTPEGRLPGVDGRLHPIQLLPLLLESPDTKVSLNESDGKAATLDADGMLRRMAELLPERDDSSIVELECANSDYSAAMIAHAVESADTHLVDLLSATTPEGAIRVTLRVRRLDPTPVVRSLERYGFKVTSIYAPSSAAETLMEERLQALNRYLNV